ncbi:MAG TPA: hypothetical protein PK504_02550 [Ferruginibacter sp.]|nr:hypothetical protein [Ferruginibacter sp.]HRE63995.1 hypothetical protein [Ferruginibacter sp.]
MKWMLTLLLQIFCFGVFAQSFDMLIKEAEALEAAPQEKAALLKFKEALKQNPTSLLALWKCSELCSRIGNREKDTKVRDAYYLQAKTYAGTALQHYPNSDDANVSMAIAMGRMAMVKSGKEKIEAVKDIKRYADIALKNNIRNFKAWHIIGKWHYEVSNLNMMEKAATKVFFGGLPASSLKDAIKAYEFAKALNPNFSLNYLELAKAYKRNDEKNKAIETLKKVADIPSYTEDDPRIKTEAAQLLKNWQ